MERLKFTIRFFIMLLALPVIMFTELTRGSSVSAQPKQVHEAKISGKSTDHSQLVAQVTVLQALYN